MAHQITRLKIWIIAACVFIVVCSGGALKAFERGDTSVSIMVFLLGVVWACIGWMGLKEYFSIKSHKQILDLYQWQPCEGDWSETECEGCGEIPAQLYYQRTCYEVDEGQYQCADCIRKDHEMNEKYYREHLANETNLDAQIKDENRNN